MQKEVKKEIPIRQIVNWFILICGVMSALGVIILIMLFSITAKCDKVEKVLSDTPHNPNAFYVSNESFYSNGNEIDIPDEKHRVLLVDSEYVYLSKRVKGNKYEIYRASYSLDNFEKITDLENPGYMAMVNSNTLVYGTYDRDASVYCVDTQKNQVCNGMNFVEACNMFRKSNYEIAERENDSSNYYEIKSIATNETRIIDENDRSQLQTQQTIKDVEETSGNEVIYYDVFEQNGKLYFQCIAEVGVFEGIILTYQYNFETEEFSFVDWIYVDDIEGCRTYIINN